MTRSITLRIFADPGHAWCRFPLKRLLALGIANKISACSYQNGANVFLEEDCDLGVLIQALQDRGYAIEFNTTTTHTKSSKIRGFQPYTYTANRLTSDANDCIITA